MGEGSVWHRVALVQCRGHWVQKSSSEEWTPKFPKQAQMRENTQKNWKPMLADR